MKNLFIGVGSALSVFVRKLGIRLIANQGPVQVQAQNDLMELLARKEISIVSTEDEIRILAKKKITLNGGGSYITLDANAIEAATLGDYRTRAGFYDRQQMANKPEDFPSIAPVASEPVSSDSKPQENPDNAEDACCWSEAPGPASYFLFLTRSHNMIISPPFLRNRTASQSDADWTGAMMPVNTDRGFPLNGAQSGMVVFTLHIQIVERRLKNTGNC